MSKFKSISLPYPSNDPMFKASNPPYSIPGVHLPDIEVHDDLVDKDLHTQLWDYLIGRVWHHQWSPAKPPELQLYRPSDWDESWALTQNTRPTISQPRTLFASDATSLEKNHPLVWTLWTKINERLDNQYEISGVPEGAKWKDYPCPQPTDPSLKKGWRVYANASPHDLLSPNGYIHRDNPDLADETSVTIIWMASPEWYPSWGGELQFYPEDPDGQTGDHQQFNGNRAQQRGFHIGWNDEGKVVSLKPNRLLVYDGRTLHSTLASNHRYNTVLHRRIVFRARRKTI